MIIQTYGHFPQNTKMVNEMYGFFSVDEGGEGLVAAPIGPDGSLLPLVGADIKRIDSLKPLAARLAQLTGKRIVLNKFRAMEDLEEFLPKD